MKDLKMISTWINHLGPRPSDKCPCKKKKRNMEEKTCEDRGRDWDDAATSQGMLEEARKNSPLENEPREPRPANTWVSDFWPLEL